MKKTLLTILLCIVMALGVTGCKKEELGTELENRTNVDVVLEIKPGTLTNNGGTFILKNNTKELITHGESYYIEKERDNKWYKLDPINPLKFNAIAYKLKDGETFERKVNWGSFYGKLESGKYRFVKDIFINSDKTTDELESENIFVEFTIE